MPLPAHAPGHTDAERVTATPDDHLCFAVYATSRAFTAQYREVLRPLGLTYPQYLALLVLWDFAQLSVSALGERLRLDSGTLSPLLKRLEAADLVVRHRSTNDERVVLIEVTAAGRRMRTRAKSVPAQVQAATGMTDEDRRGLIAQLADLTRALEAATG
jgi:DNA-binding MarR family transcriptional regulator